MSQAQGSMKASAPCLNKYAKHSANEAASSSQPTTPAKGGSARLNSNWRVEIGAVFRKEWLNESRTRSGLISSLLFSVVAVVAIALATFGKTPDPTIAAGLLWVTLLFSSILALPRSFIGEEETGTADLLRLLARPHVVFWGKALFNL